MGRAIRLRERDARPSSGSAHDLTSSRRRPAGAASPSRFRLARAASLLAAGLALLLGAATAQAQTAVKLVGNTSTGSGTAIVRVDYGQRFTTGSRTLGYKLTRVDLQLGAGDASATFTVNIHSDSSGAPGSSLGALTQQGSLPSTAAVVQFTASGTGIDLAANTDYWLVVDVTAGSTASDTIGTTNSDSEDANPSAGWSLANTFRWRAFSSSGSWDTDNRSLRLAIHGRVNGGGPSLTGYAVTDKTLTLTFDKAVKLGADVGIGDPPPQALIPYLTVKVAGRNVAVTGVALSGKTVTLTLAQAAGAGQAVTVSLQQRGRTAPGPGGKPGGGLHRPAGGRQQHQQRAGVCRG